MKKKKSKEELDDYEISKEKLLQEFIKKSKMNKSLANKEINIALLTFIKFIEIAEILKNSTIPKIHIKAGTNTILKKLNKYTKNEGKK